MQIRKRLIDLLCKCRIIEKHRGIREWYFTEIGNIKGKMYDYYTVPLFEWVHGKFKNWRHWEFTVEASFPLSEQQREALRIAFMGSDKSDLEDLNDDKFS